MPNATIDQLIGRAVSLSEMPEVSAMIREHLESKSPGSTNHIHTTSGIKNPTMDETLSEFTELRNLYAPKGTSGNTAAKSPATDELAQLKAENERLTTENAKLREQVASFDERVAFESASQVARLGFSDRPTNATSARKPNAGDAELTDTQKVLKAKGLPLNTKVQIGAGTPETIEDDE